MTRTLAATCDFLHGLSTYEGTRVSPAHAARRTRPRGWTGSAAHPHIRGYRPRGGPHLNSSDPSGRQPRDVRAGVAGAHKRCAPGRSPRALRGGAPRLVYVVARRPRRDPARGNSANAWLIAPTTTCPTNSAGCLPAGGAYARAARCALRPTAHSQRAISAAVAALALRAATPRSSTERRQAPPWRAWRRPSGRSSSPWPRGSWAWSGWLSAPRAYRRRRACAPA